MIDNQLERLPCQLTPEEKDRKADELVREIDRHALLEISKAAAAQSYAKQLKESDRKITDLGREIREGVEYRPVRVAFTKDFDRNLMHTCRLDVAIEDPRYVVSSRPLEARERQAEMFAPTLPAAAPTPEAKPSKPGKSRKAKSAEPDDDADDEALDVDEDGIITPHTEH